VESVQFPVDSTNAASLKSDFDKIFPTALSDMVNAELTAAVQKVNLFGCPASHVRHSPEPNCLGQLRIVTEGSITMLFMHTAGLRQLVEEKEGEKKSNLKMMSSTMQRISFDLAKEMAAKMTSDKSKKLHVWRATVAAGSAVYTPPGFMVAMCCSNNAKASGLRKAVLPIVETSAVEAMKLSMMLDDAPASVSIRESVNGIMSRLAVSS